jgi:hypothetical protein
MMRERAILLVLALATSSCRSTTKVDVAPPSSVGAVPSPKEDMNVECPAALLEARRDGTLPNRFVVPRDDERAQMKAIVASLLATDSAGLASVRADAARIGFELLDAEAAPGVVVLREIEGQRRGGGAYLVRLRSASRLVVQAPHTFYDEGTLPLACDLFQRAQARALFINTVHRYKGAPADANGQHPSDVAHAPRTLFQSATEGALDAVKDLAVLQLHGFATREPRARAVVSTGEKRAGSTFLVTAAKALEDEVGKPVLRYPDDTSELGATTNVQGMIVRAAGGRFLHIEMDEGLRRDLAADTALRARAFGAITRVIEAK